MNKTILLAAIIIIVSLIILYLGQPHSTTLIEPPKTGLEIPKEVPTPK